MEKMFFWRLKLCYTNEHKEYGIWNYSKFVIPNSSSHPMALFAKKNTEKRYLGVDMSADSIKIVELKNTNGKPELVTYGYVQTKPDMVKGAFIDNTNATALLLREVYEKAGCSATEVLAALPISTTFTSILKIQKISKKDLKNTPKIKSVLAKEIEKILPAPLSEMQFDYTLINEDDYKALKDEDEALDVKFLITAASNAVVKKYSDIFKQTGFKLLNLDIEPFALVRSLVGNDRSLLMVVDIGEHTTSLSLINNGIPVFNRSVDIGGSMITKKLAEVMNIQGADAEQYKLDLPILMQQQNLTELPKPIEIIIAPIIQEIKYLIATYYEQVSKEKELDRIILTGGSAGIAHLDDYFVKSLNLRTYMGDPWARVIYPMDLQNVLKEIGPRFAAAVGLAMTYIK